MPAVGCDGPKSHHTWFDLTSIKSPTDGKAALEGFLTAIAGDTTVAVSQLKAAGVPSVDNGSQVASAFVAGFTRLETALKQTASKAQSPPTTSASVFKSAAFALGSDVKGSMGDIGQSVAGLKSPQLAAAAKKAPACTALS